MSDKSVKLQLQICCHRIKERMSRQPILIIKQWRKFVACVGSSLARISCPIDILVLKVN